MKRIIFSVFLVLLLAFAVFCRYKNSAEDFGDVNSMLVSCIVQNPAVAEVFSLTDAAVET